MLDYIFMFGVTFSFFVFIHVQSFIFVSNPFIQKLLFCLVDVVITFP